MPVVGINDAVLLLLFGLSIVLFGAVDDGGTDDDDDDH